jgi:ketosteroid isomerase-like protein
VGESKAGFDFPAFREAFERKDAGRWTEFYAEDAHWIEYKPSAPPRAPIRMIGKAQIKEFIEAVSRSDLEIAIADEVVDDERVAFSVTCTFPDGKRVYEQVIVQLRGGKVARQIDVEAWD